MNKVDQLIAESEIGDEAKKFLQGNLGKVLIGFAQQETYEAQEALVKIDPTQVEEIRALQNKARFGQLFESWLNDLVVEGDNADSELRQIRQETR